MRILLIASIMTAGACGSCLESQAPAGAGARTSPADNDTSGQAPQPAPPPTPSAVTLPDYQNASPTTLRIINDRASAITLVTSDGPRQPFSIEPREGEPSFVLGGSGEVINGQSCECRCGFPCLQCEPPQYQEVVLEPGGTFDFEWSGRVRHYHPSDDGPCFDPYGVPPGPRTFRACLDGYSQQNRDCVAVDAELPTDLVELRFGGSGQVTP